MSHIPQRKEKDCLNCGTIVQGKYCHNCGQENVVPHETFGHMVKHFVYDITHFDSKFFDSMRYLLFKPGFLPQEYMKGRRASYLNPVKKYVFTSAMFFLLFFGFFGGQKLVSFDNGRPITSEERKAQIKRAEKEILKNPNNKKWDSLLITLKDTSKIITTAYLNNYLEGDNSFFNINGRKYKNLREYDSVQKMLPRGERDNFFVRLLQRKDLQIKEKYKDTPGQWLAVASKIFSRSLPYLLFVSLPLFAFILKLLYIRRKQYYYADHGIFSIYHYIFTFLLVLIVFLFDKLANLTGWEFFDIATGLTFLSGGVYLLLSMKRFYGQKWGKTILKFILLNIAGFITLAFLFTLFLLLSVFQI